MRKLLNTLYVTTPNSYIYKDGLNIVISVDQKETFRVPAINIESIVTFGYMGISPGAMSLCNEYNISITFLAPNGRFISHIHGPTKGNVILRKSQYDISDDPIISLHLARLIIAAKIQNYRSFLRRHIRDYGENQQIEYAAEQLNLFKRKALICTDKPTLLGIEGLASGAYFAALPQLIRNEHPAFSFSGRNKRPPRDAVNAMLSLAYTLIANDTTAALEAVGIDPYVGVFHTIRPGRTSLALDIMEEFRAYLGDQFVLSLINKRQIAPNDFLYQGDNSVILTDNGRRTFISAWQNRKRDTITHPYLNEKVEIGLLPHIQAMLLARFMRNEIDDYPVFLIQ